MPTDDGAISFRTIAATPESRRSRRRLRRSAPDTIAKFLFTSGSTGTPKAVINTQRMLSSSQQAKAQTWPFLDARDDDLVILDWLPWSHTFGANHNFNLVLRNGGTLYIDGGKPAPGLFATSLANLRSVMPTVYFNVPRGFDMLIAALRGDDELRRNFFGEVKFAFYAGAALPQNLWDALEELSHQDRRPARCRWCRPGAPPKPRRSPPTAIFRRSVPAISACRFRAPNSSWCRPATSSRCACAGPNVTPGYWKAPELTAQAFDAEGFYLIGDAVTLRRSGAAGARPVLRRPRRGGLQAQFRHLGQRRHPARRRDRGACAAGAGHRGHRPWRRRVRFLVFPNIAACRAHAGLPDSADGAR